MINRNREGSALPNIIKVALLLVLLPMLSISCEQFFTYSLMSWAQRDPSNLPEAQQIAYAESVLGSGDKNAMADAYDAIKDNTDPDVQLLASKLAVGASGLNEAVESAIEDIELIEDGTADINDYLSTIDEDMLMAAVYSMASASQDSNTAGTITSEEYITAAAASLIYAVNSSTVADFDAGLLVIDGATPDNSDSASWDQKAAYFLQESGYDSTDLDSLVNLNT